MIHPRGDEAPREDAEGAAYRPGDERAGLVARATLELAPRYAILQRVRTSGYWTVCAARDVEREGRVVLVSLLDRTALDDETSAAVEHGLAWGRELVHPHLVPVLEHGSSASLLWFATRGDVGRPLGALLRAEGPRDPAAALRLARQICSSLVLLHRRERVHGALCPSNVLVDEKDRARITNPATDAAVLRMRVRTGAKPGHVGAYAAPEVLAGAAPTPLSDQFSAARLLIAALGGEGAAVPEALGRASSPKPRERYPDVGTFLAALSTAWAPVQAPRPERKEGYRAPVVLVPAPLDPEEVLPEEAATVHPGRRLLSKGAATLVTAAGLFGAFLVGQTAFAGAEPPSRTDAPRGPAMPEGSGFIVYAPPAVPADTSGTAVRRPDGEAAAAGAESPDERRGGSAERERPSPPPQRANAPERREPGTASAPQRTAAREPETVRPRPPVPEATPSTPARTTAVERFGRLYMNAFPWGTVYLDGRRIGTTPIVDFPLRAGTYVVRVEREGFLPWEERVSVEAGGELRRTGIVLERRQSR